MVPREGIYPHEKQLKYYLQSIEESAKINEQNKLLLQKYHYFLINTDMALSTRIVQLQLFKTIAEHLSEKRIPDLTKQDPEELVYWIRTIKFSPQTVHKYLVSIKKLFKWLKGNGETYPPEVSWIKSNVKNSQIKLPENLLN